MSFPLRHSASLSRWPLLALAALLILLLAAASVLWSSPGPAGAQDGHQPDPQVVDDVWDYAKETQHGADHVLRWMRVLHTFGALDDMSAAEAQDHADQFWAARWDPVVTELTNLEAQDDYTPDQQVVDDVRGYSAETDNGFDHVLRWMRVLHTLGALTDMSSAEAQGYADQYTPARWDPVVSELTAMETAASAAEPDPDPTATPEPTPTPQPNRAPVVNTQAKYYSWFTENNNAPRGVLVSKPFRGIFSDPDGDNLSYSVAISGGDRQLVELLLIPPDGQSDDLTAQSSYPIPNITRVWFQADGDDDWKAITPTLPDQPVITVTLTATDPEGLTASVSGDFLIWWESYPEVVRARADGPAIELTFDWAVENDPAPAPGQFTVRVVNEDGTAGTVGVNSVSVNGKVMTLELASALDESQTVTLDYAYSYPDDTPLQRAGGGDAAPSFTGLAVTFLQPPGEPQNFAVSATPGQLNLLATWDEADGATSYKLRWRQSSGEFDAANAATVSDAMQFITVSDYGQWEIRVQICNDTGCGPEASRTVDVVQELRSSLAAQNAGGNAQSRTITASWNEVEDAASYTLLWQRIDSDAPAQPAADRQSRAVANSPDPGRSALSAPQASGADGRVNDSSGENRLDLPAGRTSADFNLPDGGAYRVDLQAHDAGNELIARSHHHVNQASDQPDTTRPRLEGGQMDGDRMILHFSEPLNENIEEGHFHPYVQYRNCWCATGGLYRAAMEVSGNKVVVDFKGSIRAVEGLGASVSYWVRPGDTSLRDLAGNKVWTRYGWYEGSRSTRIVYLHNITGRPRVSGVAISSDAGDDRFYVEGETIRVTLTFSEAVDVTGTPRVQIDLDPADGGERWADYSGGSGTARLTFDYTVAAGDFSPDGVAALGNTLELNGGAIRSASAITVENARLRHAGLGHDPLHRVATPTAAAPVLMNASVTGTALTLIFSEPMGAAASLANSAFTVKKTPQGGDEQTVSLSGSPAINGVMVTLTLASAALDTDTSVKVSYAKPSSGSNNKLVDAGGAEAASFTDEIVRNLLDTTPPRLLRGEVDRTTLTYYFSEPLDEDVVGGIFWVDRQGPERQGWSYSASGEVEISGNIVRVGLGHGRVMLKGEEVLSNYRKPYEPGGKAIRDIAGNEVTPGSLVLHNLLGPLPTRESATVIADRLTLTFDVPMDDRSKPAASAFTVKVNGSAVSLANTNPVSVSGHTATLTLAAAVATGDVVTLSYDKPWLRPLRNYSSEADSFTDEPVRNITGASLASVAVTSDAGDDNTYGLGDTIEVAVTFGEAVTVTGAPRLKIKMDPRWGRFWANYDSGSGTDTLTFVYTVVEPNTSPQGIAVLAHSLELNGGQIRSTTSGENVHLAHLGLAHDPDHKVDWRRPPEIPHVTGVAITSDPGDDDTYGLGDTIEVAVTFSEAADVVTTGGKPRLKIKMAPDSGEKWADYSEGSGTTTLTFVYTVVEPNTSPQGIGMLAHSLELNGGQIQTAASGENVHLAHSGLAHDPAHKVDWRRPPEIPQVTGVAVTSDPGVDDTYALGDTIRVTLTFSDAADVVTTGGKPRLKIKMAPTSGEKWAAYSGGRGTTTLTFDYTVAEGDISTDGVAVLANTLALNGGKIRSTAAQRDALLKHAGLDHNTDHLVDWQSQEPGAPLVTGVAITSNPGDDDTYALGENIQVTATFSEAVNVDTTGGTPRLGIRMAPHLWWFTTDDRKRWADYSGGSGTAELTFDYTVAAENRSTQGVAVLKNALEFNGGAIRSAATPTVNAHLRYEGLWHDLNHLVDGRTPALLSVAVAGTTVSLTYDEALDLDSAPPASAFTVRRTPQGGAEETVALTESPVIAAGAVLLTLDEPVLDTDTGVTVSYDHTAANAGGRLRDLAGNAAASFSNHAVDPTDTTPPRLVRGEVNGDTMTIYFSEPLDEDIKRDANRFAIGILWEDGSPSFGRCGNLRSTFWPSPKEVYVVGNTAVVVGFGELATTRASTAWTITNFGRYYADITTPVEHRFRDLSGNLVSTPKYIDEQYRATRILWHFYLYNVTTLPTPERATVVGDRLTLTFDAPLKGGQTPAASAFTVTVDGSQVSLASANPVSVSGRKVTLTLASAVAAGADVKVSYERPSSRWLRNVVCEYAPSFSDEPALNFTGVSPATVAITSDPGDDDTYGLGDVIRVRLTFSEAVTVTGAPRLKIKMGPGYGEKWADYESGSGTNTLTFAYTVVKPNTSPTGIAVLANTLELKYGALRYASSGNPAYLAHAGLAHNPAHKVDWQR